MVKRLILRGTMIPTTKSEEDDVAEYKTRKTTKKPKKKRKGKRVSLKKA